MNNNKDIISLGQLVSELRKKMGCSQRKFAEISGLSNATISRIENGETHSPDIETLKLLAAHLNYPLDELIKLMEQSLERYKSKGQAKLIFLLTPTRRIKRYSSVCTSIIEKEEEQLKEQTLEQAPDQETHKDISLKGMRLITLRLEKNITQKELAEALSIDKSLISQYEGEIIKPDYVLIQRLADFFDVTVEYLTDSLVSEVISYQETKDLFRDTTRDKLLQTKGLRPEYLVIAEEIQDAGIEVEDVRAFIKLIKKYKGSSI